ncbi:hypothetical protein Q5752_003466 [Cryptotrichosporon argae]
MSDLTVFLTTFNTGLQGSKAQEQDLSGWLVPVLHDAAGGNIQSAPDIYAIAVQELLPLHLALAGLSGPVLVALTTRIRSLLSAHATSLSPDRTPEKYDLVSRVSHVGVALWVFAKRSSLGGRLGRAQEARVGLWYGGMGNKGAVGVRLPVRRGDNWETLTFVSTHLDAHDRNISRRNAQYNTILSSLVFPSTSPLASSSQPHDTSHLFVLGDLNYRLARLPVRGVYPRDGRAGDDVRALAEERAPLLELDTLRAEQREGRAFGGLREGDLTRFAPTYKRIVGQVEGYSKKRIPGWTDRILFASYTDPTHLFSPHALLVPTPAPAPSTATQILHFSSSPDIVLSDHKPVHALLVLPAPAADAAAPAPHLAPTLPAPPPPHPRRPEAQSAEVLLFWSVVGTVLDRAIGWPWVIAVLLGFGNAQAGLGVGGFLAMVWGVWWTGVFSA